jgi:hypothetical protein
MTEPNRLSDRRALDPQIEALLNPSAAFAHPRDVAADPDLTTHEKRAILSSWASDACAVESCPPLRRPPGAKPVTFDEVMDALISLDENPPPRPGGKGMRSRSGSGPEPDRGGSRVS